MAVRHSLEILRLVAGFALFCTFGFGQPSFSEQIASHELWVIPFKPEQADEMVLAQTMQGLTGSRKPALWLDCGAMSGVILNDLQKEGLRIQRANSIWELPDSFWRVPSGYITYKLNDHSLSIASSMAGPLNAVAATESLAQRLRSKGLSEKLNAIGLTEQQLLIKYRNQFAPGLAVEQALDKPSHLRDYAVMNKAFVFSAGRNDALRKWFASSYPQGSLFLGWGPDEYRWIRAFSECGSQGVAADWCVNLSALSRLPVSIPVPRKSAHPAVAQAGQRIIAFVLTDGDNLQWLTGNMPLDEHYFANKHRGEFEMNWGISPFLSTMAPRVLKYMYDHASDRDCFFAAGSPGYRYIHAEPGAKGTLDASQTKSYLQASRLNTVCVINDNEGSQEELIPLVSLPEVDGVIYFSFAPYNRLKGKVLWHQNKPIVASRFMLWQNLPGCSIDGVVRQIQAMPANPQSDPNSYAIVAVHAWSFNDIGGPIEAVRQTISRLPTGTRVVSIRDFFTLLRDNCSPKIPGL